MILREKSRLEGGSSSLLRLVFWASVSVFELVTQHQCECKGSPETGLATDMKEASAHKAPKRGRGGPRRKSLTQVLEKRSQSQELEAAEHEMKSLGMEGYCSMLRLLRDFRFAEMSVIELTKT